MAHRALLWTGSLSAVIVGLAVIAANAGEIVMSSRQVVVDGSGAVGTVSKVLDTQTRQHRLVSDVPGIATMADLDAVRQVRREGELQVHGVIRGTLRDTLAKLGDNDTIRVLMALKTPEVRYLNRFTHTQAELRAQSEQLATIQPRVSAQTIVDRYGLVARNGSPEGHAFECYATKGSLLRAKYDDAIAAITVSGDPKLLATGVPFSRLALYALNPSAHPADQQGASIHVATIEDGLPEDCWSNLCQTPWPYIPCKGFPIYCSHYGDPTYCGGQPDCSAPRCPTGPGQGCPTACCEYSVATRCDFLEHTVWCFTCLLNSAPQAVPHHVHGRWETTADYIGLRILRWQLETASQSTTTTSRDEDEAPCLDMDDWTYRWPCPLFANPAGNGGASDEVYWQGYNGISVGSTKKLWGNYYQLDEFTSGRNPDPKYGWCISPPGSPCAGDREMPEILAPGSNPYTNNDWDPNYYWYDKNLTECFPSFPPRSGTSFAAPTLNGAAARVASSALSYRYMPDVLKLFLLLTAQNVHGAEWDVNDDGRDGAGVVSAYSAVEFATTHTRVWTPGPPAVENGLYLGFGAQGMPQYTNFQVKVPASLPSGKHLRACLVWTSNPDLSAGYNEISDLDLSFSGGGLYYSSGSWDANVEIVDVPRSALTPGATYTLTVIVWDVRIPAGARAQYFYYDVGWTWVKDHAP